MNAEVETIIDEIHAYIMTIYDILTEDEGTGDNTNLGEQQPGSDTTSQSGETGPTIQTENVILCDSIDALEVDDTTDDVMQPEVESIDEVASSVLDGIVETSCEDVSSEFACGDEVSHLPEAPGSSGRDMTLNVGPEGQDADKIVDELTVLVEDVPAEADTKVEESGEPEHPPSEEKRCKLPGGRSRRIVATACRKGVRRMTRLPPPQPRSATHDGGTPAHVGD